MKNNFYDILIIGGSAAGLMAAIKAKEEALDLKVAVLEKNMEPGKKLYATGNGRCNFLNVNAGPHDYCSLGKPDSVPILAETVLSSEALPNLLAEFSRLGIEAMQEDDGRLYPRSMQAKSIVNALVGGAIRRGVDIFCNFEVSEIQKSDHFIVKALDGSIMESEVLILACGGKAGIQYGCTGDGFKIAKEFGHTVFKPIPALTQLLCREDLSNIAGVRARGRISLVSSKDGAETVVCEDSGELQFNKDSLSGICTFNVSRFYQIKEGVSYLAELDLIEECDENQLCHLFAKRKKNFADGCAEDLLSGLFADKLVLYILERAGLDAERPMESIGEEDLEDLAALCKALTFDIVGTKSWKDAQVTAGGVSLEEVNPASLESKKIGKLFFAGEILDMDGPCGGYNLTWAFASGFVAGIWAAHKAQK